MILVLYYIIGIVLGIVCASFLYSHFVLDIDAYEGVGSTKITELVAFIIAFVVFYLVCKLWLILLLFLVFAKFIIPILEYVNGIIMDNKESIVESMNKYKEYLDVN